MHALPITAPRDQAIVSLNVKGQIKAWQFGAANLGYSAGYAVGESYLHLFNIPKTDSDMLTSAAEQGVIVQACELKREDQSPFPALVTITANHEPSRRPLSYTAIIRDLSPTQRAAEAFAIEKQLRSDLESLNRRLIEFFTNMCHELRTPLQGVTGGLEIIQANHARMAALLEQQASKLNSIAYTAMKDSFNEATDMLHMLLQATAQQTIIINDILDFTKLEENKVELQDVCFSPIKRVRYIEEILRLPLKDKGIILELKGNCGDDSNQGILIKGDPFRFTQIVLNLLTNAIKFSLANSKVIISLEYDNDEQMLYVSVKDFGKGMSETQVKNLFQKFKQADASIAGNYGGSGLGLVISKALCELMGGTMTAMSREGFGSEFLFNIHYTLPTAEESSEYATRNTVVATTPAEEKYHGKLLLVDDHPANQKVTAVMLRKVGYTVAVASDGAEALTAWESASKTGFPYELILTDVSMPVMDGYELARQIRAKEQATLKEKQQNAKLLPAAELSASTVPAVQEKELIERKKQNDKPLPIIGLSASALAADRDKAIDAGMTDYLTKPVGRILLIQTINKYLSPTAADTDTSTITSPSVKTDDRLNAYKRASARLTGILVVAPGSATKPPATTDQAAAADKLVIEHVTSAASAVKDVPDSETVLSLSVRI